SDGGIKDLSSEYIVYTNRYRYFFKLLYRIGTIGGNIIFGFAFFMVARRVTSSKLKDYLTITAIGDTLLVLHYLPLLYSKHME
ncbi:MAG: hypothetical protein ABJB85_10645, partial [Nitrososphaerota archaeon]